MNQKKLHGLKIGMCLLLVILIGRLLFIQSKEKETEPLKQQSIIGWEDDLEVFVSLENEAVKEISENPSNNLPAYTSLYPNLYAEPLEVTTMKEDGPKTAYLTFDDGPSNRTCEVLDILDKANIKATFFIVGETITEKGKECLKQMVEDGHTIGLHTYSHNYKKLYSSVESFLEDYDKLFC